MAATFPLFSQQALVPRALTVISLIHCSQHNQSVARKRTHKFLGGWLAVLLCLLASNSNAEELFTNDDQAVDSSFLSNTSWQVQFEPIDISGDIFAQHDKRYMDDENSYLEQLVRQSSQYIGWGVKFGGDLTILPNLTAGAYLGAFNWENRYQQPASGWSLSTKSGVSPYGGADLRYHLSPNSHVKFNWNHFLIQGESFEQVGISFSYQF